MAEREEERTGERLLRRVSRLGLVVVELILIDFVEVGPREVRSSEDNAVELKQTIGSGLLRVALLAVEYKTNRPSYYDTVVAIETRVAAQVHSCLEAARGGTVARVHLASVEVVGGVRKLASKTFGPRNVMLEKVAEVKGSAVEPSALLSLSKPLLCEASAIREVADAETKLHVARIAIISVEVVIPTTISDEVLAVDRATKPLEGVVVAIADLHVVNRRSCTHRTERKTVDLLVLLEGIASKLDADILQHTRVVVGVGATMLRTRTSLYLLGEHAIVVGSLATDDHTTPVARTTAARSLLRGEDDRFCGRTLGNEFATGLHDNSRLGLLCRP